MIFKIYSQFYQVIGQINSTKWREEHEYVCQIEIVPNMFTMFVA